MYHYKVDGTLVIANSEIEAKIIYLTGHHFSDNEIYDFNHHNILEYYYKIPSKYHNYMLGCSYYQMIFNWQSIKDKLASIVDTLYEPSSEHSQMIVKSITKINPNITNFSDAFKSKNKKIILDVIKHNYVPLHVIKMTPLNRTTFISIKRIIKKSRNNNYWNILRLFLF